MRIRLEVAVRAIGLTCAVAVLVVPAVSGAAPQPCSLLTPAQIGAALGASFGAAEPIGTTGCSWSAASPHLIVTVSHWPPTEWNRMKTSPLYGTTITPTSGLGDDAFYATIAQYTVLYVKKGNDVWLFKVYGVTDKSKQMSVEKTLAQDALQHL